jgi:hypothetical protein
MCVNALHCATDVNALLR